MNNIIEEDRNFVAKNIAVGKEVRCEEIACVVFVFHKK